MVVGSGPVGLLGHKNPTGPAYFAPQTTYVNFLVLGDWNAERMRAAYSPEDWERLVELKDRYDPNNLFHFNRNIPPSSARE